MDFDKFDGDEAKRVLFSMLHDAKVLERVAPLWKRPGLFAASASNTVGDWCVRHWRKHHEAPTKKNVVTYMEEWSRKEGKDSIQSMSDLVEDVFRTDVDNPSTQRSIEIADLHFNRVQANQLKERIGQEGCNGQLPKVLEEIEKFEPINLNDEHVTASEVEVKNLRYLWHPFLPYNEMTIADGFPGQGKSLKTLDVAARTSNGWAMPPAPRGEVCVRKPASVVLLTGEDDWGHTVVPRLMAAGADLSKIHKPGKEPISFPHDLPLVESLIRKTKAKLLIIDPIMAFIGDAKTDTNTESHVRRFLLPLVEMTRRTHISTLLVRHFKKEGASAIHRGMGSQAWTAACRIQIAVGDPDGSGTVVVALGKCNLTAKPKSLGFRIEPHTVHVTGETGKDFSIDTARIEWVGEVETTANDVAGADRNQKGPGKKERAVELIQVILEEDGEMDSEELERQVMRLGISKGTYELAKKEAGVMVKRTGGLANKGKWVCSLRN